MKTLPSCLVALAFVSLAFTPALAANSALLNGPMVGGKTIMVERQAPTQVTPTTVGFEVTEVAPVVELQSELPVGFSPAEHEALADLSMIDSELVDAAGAGAVVIGLGGILVVALIVLLILILTDTIELEESTDTMLPSQL
jgi:hypothetical protein